ncbi:DUF6924 domain-containing protein [Nocardia alni]|uniref:DUF6924 domain-containing protein n=1 Tax=Nocardia alni TaxID=2815723 RepID=UPI001C2145F1|nr:hypothetical protein [Nocardia alni]
MGIEVFVEIIDDPVYRDVTVEQFLELEDADTAYVMLADRETMTGAEHPILFLDLFEEQPSPTVRVVSSELCDVVTNVDNANITIEDYARAAEEAGEVGVFRGFA